MTSNSDAGSSSGAGRGGGSSSRTNWDPYLRHSSAIGIVKPSVFDVYNTSGGSSSSSSRYQTGSYTSGAEQPPSRVAHSNPDGSPSFTTDSFVSPSLPLAGMPGVMFEVLDRRLRVPAQFQEVEDTETTPTAAAPAGGLQVPEQGAVCAMVDLAPGSAWPARRAGSVDYVVVLAGQVVVRLEAEEGVVGGDERILARGAVAIIQGQRAEWRNRGTGAVRLLVVMLAVERPAGLELEAVEEESPGFGIGS